MADVLIALAAMSAMSVQHFQKAIANICA